jgi:AcrR family transcriptional regulator
MNVDTPHPFHLSPKQQPTMPGTVPTNGKLSRRERERLMRRREIMEAAQAVFAEKGYTHATLDEIAQRAEYGKGTLYNYFEGGKEDILFAIFDGIYDDLCQLLQDALSSEKVAGRSFREAFHDLVIAWIDFFVERQEWFMILVKEAYRMVFDDDPGKASYFQMHAERIVHALCPALEAAMQTGELRPLPAPSVAHMILGNLKGIQMHMCLHTCNEAQGPPVLHSAEAAADFLTTMLCDGLVAPSPPYLASDSTPTIQHQP